MRDRQTSGLPHLMLLQVPCEPGRKHSKADKEEERRTRNQKSEKSVFAGAEEHV